MTLLSSASQSLLEEIIKMSESAVMSAESSMRSAMLAKDQANSALSAARLMMNLQRSEESHQQVVGLQSDQVSSSTSSELDARKSGKSGKGLKSMVAAKKSKAKKKSGTSKKTKAIIPVDPDQLISQLPGEVWLEVLSYFTSQELCSLGLVCKSLLRLTRDPALWTEISLLGDAITVTKDLTISQFRSILLYINYSSK